MAARRAHREQLQRDRPGSDAGLQRSVSELSSAQHWALRPLRDWSAAGRVPRSRASPVVLDRAAGPRPVRRNGKRGSAESRTPRRSAALKDVRQPGGAKHGTFRAHRQPVDGPVRLAGTLAPQRRRRGRHPSGCVRRQHRGRAPAADARVRQPAAGGASGRSGAAAAYRPGRRAAAVTEHGRRTCDRGGRPSPGPATRQRGLKGPGPVRGSCLRGRPARWRRGGVITSANECRIVLDSPSRLRLVLFSPAVHERHLRGANRTSTCWFPEFR